MAEEERMKQKAEKKRLKKKVAGGQEEWEPRGIWERERGILCEDRKELKVAHSGSSCERGPGAQSLEVRVSWKPYGVVVLESHYTWVGICLFLTGRPLPGDSPVCFFTCNIRITTKPASWSCRD